jgi:hypothetical protein
MRFMELFALDQAACSGGRVAEGAIEMSVLYNQAGCKKFNECGSRRRLLVRIKGRVSIYTAEDRGS